MSIIVVCFVAIVGVLVTSESAFAASDDTQAVSEASVKGGVSIVLSPVSSRFDIQAGETKRGSLTLINDGKQPYEVRLYTGPYSVDGESYIPNFTDKTPLTDAPNWVTFDQTTYQLKAGQSFDVGYTVKVPTNATPGGQYGVLFAETQPTGDPTTNSVQSKKRVGSILYVTVKGDYKTSGELLETSVPLLQIESPVSGFIRVKNDGNSDFIAKNTITVKSIFGRSILNQTKDSPVLPSTTRKIDIVSQNTSSFGVYKVDITTEFLNKTSSSQHYVFLIPVWIYFIAALLLIGIVVLLYRRFKK